MRGRFALRMGGAPPQRCAPRHTSHHAERSVTMRAVLNAYGRALLSQLHGKMLMLSVLPFLLSVALWAALLYLGLQPLIDALQAQFVQHDAFRASSSLLTSLGLGMFKTVVVPLIAMLLLLPLMILTALIFIGVAAMPVIVRHVGRRHYARLEQKRGGSVIGSVFTALAAFALFALAWLVTLPLYAFPPLALVVQMLLWGWLTCRVMTYDALAFYASADERAELRQRHRWSLLSIASSPARSARCRARCGWAAPCCQWCSFPSSRLP